MEIGGGRCACGERLGGKRFWPIRGLGCRGAAGEMERAVRVQYNTDFSKYSDSWKNVVQPVTNSRSSTTGCDR